MEAPERVTGPQGATFSARVTIARTPDELYAMVSAVSRMGEWSPDSPGGRWDDPEVGPVEGAWFTGLVEGDDGPYETRCRVVAADPGREFAFVNCGRTTNEPAEDGIARWGYRFTVVDGGTEVEESWRMLPALEARLGQTYGERLGEMVEVVIARSRERISQTLENLARMAESQDLAG